MRRFLSLVRPLTIVVLPAVLVSGCRCPPCLPDANCACQLSAPGSPMHAPGGTVLEQVRAPAGCKWAFKGDVPIRPSHASPARSGRTVRATDDTPGMSCLA